MTTTHETQPEQMGKPRSLPDWLSVISDQEDLADYEAELSTSVEQLFAVDLSKRKNRIKLLLRHPMLDQRYVAQTQEIKDFKDIVFDWVVARKSGLYASGLHRQGKTTAMNQAIEQLQCELPFVAFLSFSGERDLNQKKPSFCRHLLSHWGYESLARERGSQPERLLANFLMLQCSLVKGRQCVIFIDEAQLLSIQHYRYLLEIWNDLRAHGFILCTVLVGQPDLKLLKTLTDESDHGAVVSRFFVKNYEFGGIKSQTMLADFLRHYDQDLAFPPGSAWTYSRFFLQQAFDRGWRLEAEAPLFWDALLGITQAKAPAIRTTGFRLAWIVDAIHSFLLDGMPQDSKSFCGSVQRWEECILSGADETSIL